MCGRYVLAKDDPSAIEKYYSRKMHAKYRGANYNVSPTQSVPIVTVNGVEEMRWGLVPQWAKGLNTGYSMINAMAETLPEKRTYSSLLKSKRCLVPATGFFEWVETPTGKIPHFFHLKDKSLFSFAGLYTSRKDSEGVEMKSFTIITTKPNKLVAKVHDRMPVMLSKADEKLWLDESITDPADLLPLLDAYPAEEMDEYIVTTAMNRPGVNSPDFIKPVE